jgi:hypothetical protein
VKGDARAEAPSSSTRSGSRLVSVCDRYAGRGFALFVLLHFAVQAFRAGTDVALPEAGWELKPWFVATVSLAVWLPFAIFAWREFGRGRASVHASANPKARALGIFERIALAAVLLFTVLHVAQLVWPLLRGTFAPDDVRPELVAALSSTEHGVPLLASTYLCAVGAAAFLGTRQAVRAEPGVRAGTRVAIALGIFAYLLGSYAVIRCASGAILP